MNIGTEKLQPALQKNFTTRHECLVFFLAPNGDRTITCCKHLLLRSQAQRRKSVANELRKLDQLHVEEKREINYMNKQPLCKSNQLLEKSH